MKAGGGGGGGAVVSQSFSISGGITGNPSYSIIVGAGGNGSVTDINANQRDGQASSFNNGTLFTAGGGGGGGSSTTRNGREGSTNSSGGGAGVRFNNDTGSGGLGNGSGRSGGDSDVSNGNNNDKSGGGGGGAGGNGSDAPSNGSLGGNGGQGAVSAISGTSLRYGAGGGGGSGNTPGNGGLGGGGNGGNNSTAAQNGTVNTGSGGGGAGGGSDNRIGGNGGSGVVIIRYENFRILPVDLLYFKANFNSITRSGDLTWATAKEWENSHFEIERSVNDVKSWETIGQVQGAGYSDQPVAYTFQDLELPLTGGNIFYRLKQVDLNGKSIFSDTKAIQVEALAGTTSWRVYPNPTTGDVINLKMLEKTTYKDEKVNLRLISPIGHIEVIEGYNSSQLSGQLTEFLKRKIGGIYTLEINWDDKREYHKVILKR